MWLFSRYGFFSAACARRPDGALDADTLMIRARRKAHLRQLKERFPALAGAEILKLAGTDYGYRLIVPKAVWLEVLREMAAEQEWSNFKSEAARFQGREGGEYVHALHEVWEVMYRFQEAERR